MDVYLGQFWQDPRLALGINKTVVLGGDFVDRFWLPDTFFVNSVNTKVHEVIVPNKKIWIELNGGYMMLSARLKSKTSCRMDLRRYPMDQQTCHLALESCEYWSRAGILLDSLSNQSINQSINHSVSHLINQSIH